MSGTRRYHRFLELLALFGSRPLGVATAALVLTGAVGYLLFSLILFWLKIELTRAALESVGADAALAAATLQRELDGPLAPVEPPPPLRDAIDAVFERLLARHEPMLALMLTDAHQRVVRIGFGERIERLHPGLLDRISFPRPLVGCDAQTLVALLGESFPRARTVRVAIRDARSSPVGQLCALIDEDAAAEWVERVAARTPVPVSLALLSVGAVLSLGGAILARRRQAERERRLRSDEAERLAYVGTLAAGLAHEIRNPLNALAMQVDMLEEDVASGPTPALTRRLAVIRDGLHRIERTVSDFLRYAEPGRQSPANVELLPLLRTLSEDFQAAHPDRPVRVECVAAPGLTAWCDPNALRQIVSNLLANGLEAQDGAASPARLRIEAAREGRRIAITVEDAGAGVPDPVRDEIFRCFFTTRSNGTGLGLALARRLAEMNGGSLTLDPNRSPLGGARFRLLLPARPAQAPAER